MKKVISTKKLTDFQQKIFQNHAIELWQEDFISISFEEFSPQIISDYDFLIITSKNSVKSILRNKGEFFLKNKKVFCVGDETKKILLENKANVVCSENYAVQLAEVILKNYSQFSFLFLCGNLRRNTLPEALKKAKINFSEQVIYQTHYTPHLVDFKADAILFFSPSGVRSYLIYNEINNEKLFCIGKTTAQSLQNFSKNCIIANSPTIQGVIDEFIKNNVKND